MKNYRVQILPPLRCASCVHAFIRDEYDEMPTFYCTKDAEPRPICLSVYMDECAYEQDIDDWDELYDAWDAWSNKYAVESLGLCDDYETKGINYQ